MCKNIKRQRKKNININLDYVYLKGKPVGKIIGNTKR